MAMLAPTLPFAPAPPSTLSAALEHDEVDVEITLDLDEEPPPTLRSRVSDAPVSVDRPPAVICAWLDDSPRRQPVEIPWGDEHPTSPLPRVPAASGDRDSHVRAKGPTTRARRG